ncbi:putative type VI secretion system effector [Buttiauxella brennerae]|uniref:putative type VI secretion system effector n=1 Tax=Buttiauxella brennerae TaxID=82988 RepID=UPI00286F6616|nr:putative type VI secretion system effector [Buttiauxella brennerae]
MTLVEQKQVCSRFVEPEKLADLRTKQEIELMNGGPWTQELPPPPILPPYGPLEKISGRLESFSSEYFREYFDVKAYRTSTLPNISEGQRGGGAAVAIAAGSPGVGTALMAESESSNDTAEYVQGIINDRPFRGWVGITRFQSGDTVEMVAEWQHDHYEVYAIALPEERIVSVCPKCDMGNIAHMLWRIKNMFILAGVLLLMFIAVCLIKYLLEDDSSNAGFWGYYGPPIFVMFCGDLIVSGLIAFFAYKASAPTRCKLAEEIFHLLGMKNVARVNLNKITKAQEQHLKDNGRWHDPGDKSKPACPSGKFIYSGESWFYY